MVQGEEPIPGVWGLHGDEGSLVDAVQILDLVRVSGLLEPDPPQVHVFRVAVQGRLDVGRLVELALGGGLLWSYARAGRRRLKLDIAS